MELNGIGSTDTQTLQAASGTSGMKKEIEAQVPSNVLNSTLEIAGEPGFVGLVGLSALLPE